jgi:hypothetical protein
MEDISARFDQVFPDRFAAAKKTLADDIAWMKAALRSR